jgi:hypothetical protein
MGCYAVSDVRVNVASVLVEIGSSILIRHALSLAPHVAYHRGPRVFQTGLLPGESRRGGAATNGSGSYSGLCGPLITVAELPGVTDTKPRLLRVQIDIWPIHTVNSAKCT